MFKRITLCLMLVCILGKVSHIGVLSFESSLIAPLIFSVKTIFECL